MSSTILPDDLIKQLNSSRDFFNRSTRVLEESDSTFAPKEGMLTVSQQVTHVAQTLEWFIEGASRPEGFDLDFEKAAQMVEGAKSLEAARKYLDASYAKAVEFVRKQTPESLAKPLPPGPVMGGDPVADIFWGMIEHTAHHRGALTAYSRMLGKVPPMPYAG